MNMMVSPRYKRLIGVAAGLLLLAFAAAVQAATIALPKTGQTTSYGMRDDGDLKKGVAWPSPRFTDNSNGTVTDNLTGLIWLKKPSLITTMNWSNALATCNSLTNGLYGLTDGSVAGDWHLPNELELRSKIDYSKTWPMLPTGHPFTLSAGQHGFYWSSTAWTNSAGAVYTAVLYNWLSELRSAPASSASYYVWPVRIGPGAATAPCRVPKTGVTTSRGPRDDGDLELGVAWPVPRFTDNGNGTVTDNLTGLVWLKKMSGTGSLGRASWAQSLTNCAALAHGTAGLTDGSVAGDWRMPNVLELKSVACRENIPRFATGHPFSYSLSPDGWTYASTHDNYTGYPVSTFSLDFGGGDETPWSSTGSIITWAVRDARAIRGTLIILH